MKYEILDLPHPENCERCTPCLRIRLMEMGLITEERVEIEDKTEIKNRMLLQFKASQAGISENKLDGRGKINLAKYFVTIECYDYSVSEDETINLKDGIKDNMVTRIGLQVRFTDAETGVLFGGSGLGEATTKRELTLLSDATIDPIKFNQSTISIATKKALDIACANILDRMIKKGIFTK